jgi:anti-sigma factor RsiW
VTCQHVTSVGAYLLGAMEPPDRYALEYHLNSCRPCRTELVRLAPLPGLLHQLTPGEFENLMEENTGPFSNPMLPTFDVPSARDPDPPELPEPFFDPAFLIQEMARPWPEERPEERTHDRADDRLADRFNERLNERLGEARGSWPAEEPEDERPTGRLRRKPRWMTSRWLPNRWVAGIAAAVFLVVATGVTLAVVADSDSTTWTADGAGTAAPVTWTATDAHTGVRAWAELTGRPWGTELRLRLESLPSGKRTCNLLVKGKDGVMEIAGRWSSGQDAELVMDIPASTSVTLDQIEHLEVITNGGVLVNLASPR